MDFITVRVGCLPGTIQEVALDEGSTVSTAIENSGLNADGYETRIDGEMVDSDHALSDGDTVLLVKKIKGN